MDRRNGPAARGGRVSVDAAHVAVAETARSGESAFGEIGSAAGRERACLSGYDRIKQHTRFSRDWSSDVCSSDLRWVVRELARALDVEGLGAFVDDVAQQLRWTAGTGPQHVEVA